MKTCFHAKISNDSFNNGQGRTSVKLITNYLLNGN